MVIAIIGPRVYPTNTTSGVSGLEVRTEKVVSYLSKKHKVHVFIRNWTTSKETTSNTIHIHKMPAIQNLYFDTVIYSFFATIQGLLTGCDVFMYEGTGSTSFQFIPKLLGKKIVTTIHTQEWKREKWNTAAKIYLQLLERMCVYISHKIIVVSYHLQQHIKGQYNISASLIPYTVKNSSLSDSALHKLHLKKENYILYMGRITPEKRVHWIVNAYKKINTKLKLVIAGEAGFNQTYYQQVSNNFEDYGIFFIGHVFGEIKESLLQNCALFVLPSTIEGLSIGLLEAMNYKRKVLASDLPQHRIMLPADNLFKTNSYRNFKKKLVQLISTNEERIEYDFLKSLPSENQFSKEYEKIIRNLEQNR